MPVNPIHCTASATPWVKNVVGQANSTGTVPIANRCQPCSPPEFGEFHAPVQRAEEGEDDRAVGDLDVLEVVQVVEGRREVDPGERRLA